MEFHPTWLIVIGLGFDIVGAFLIVLPIVGRFVKIKDDQMGAPESGYVDKNTSEPNYELKGSIKAKAGIALLVMGFVLQIIGNWFLNPPM